MVRDLDALKKELVAVSQLFYNRGWSLATSGNYSARVDQNTVLITSSGKDKSLLAEVDVIPVDLKGKPIHGGDLLPSAETLLHCALYRHDSNINSVLHVHSTFSTVLSQTGTELKVRNLEMLKALHGVNTHEHVEVIPIFPNTQNITALADELIAYLHVHSQTHAFLISGHGLYTWGESIAEARRHVEAFEFLLECEFHLRQLQAGVKIESMEGKP